MSSTPNNAIPYVPENTIDPAAGLNLSLRAIDALLQLSVVSVGGTTPPAAPAEGDRYIVGPGASGDWANQSGKLATWTGGVWEFRTAWYAVTGGDLWVFDGLGWTNTAFDVGTAAARDAIGAGDVYARGGILGTVGQSGGVPTGAIIERGSNSDGEYIKFADGTLYCFGVIDIDLSQPMTQFSKAFPHQFPTHPTVLLGGSAYTISSSTHKALSDVRANIPTNTLLRIQTGNEVSSSSLPFQYFARGVWFQ